MPRRSKKPSLKNLFRSASRRHRFIEKHHDHDAPDGSVLVSTTAVDAVSLHCGLSKEQFLELIFNQIQETFKFIRKLKQPTGSTDSHSYSHEQYSLKISGLPQRIIVSYRVLENRKTNARVHQVLIDIAPKRIRFDFDKIVSRIFEKHLLGK